MRIIAILLITVLLSACSGTMKYYKQGQKQEAAGMLREAADNYYVSVQRKRANVDAQIALKTTGQLVLNEMLNDFSKAKNFGNMKDAVYAFHKARDYRDKISGVGVSLLLADFYVSDYESAKNVYLMDIYEKGTTLLEEQKYQEAEAMFNEIKKIDSNFKDTKDLGDIAYLEPLYAEALKAMSSEEYRKAYNNFDKVIARKAEYKDAKSKKEEALQKGTYAIALLPFVNSTSTTGLDAKVNAYTLEALINIKDPFLKIVDREHMQAIISEQKLQLSGIMDEQTAVTVGELVGAQAILTGTVLNYESKSGRLRTTSREAYESYKVKKLNETDGKYYYETRYKPTTYTEYYNSNTCTVSFQYKLVSLKTGEILKSAIIDKDMKDEVIYGKFDGDINNLQPAGLNGPNLNNNDRNTLIGLINGRQELKSSGDISNDLFNTISKQMSKEISEVVITVVK